MTTNYLKNKVSAVDADQIHPDHKDFFKLLVRLIGTKKFTSKEATMITHFHPVCVNLNLEFLVGRGHISETVKKNKTTYKI